MAAANAVAAARAMVPLPLRSSDREVKCRRRSSNPGGQIQVRRPPPILCSRTVARGERDEQFCFDDYGCNHVVKTGSPTAPGSFLRLSTGGRYHFAR